MIQQTFEKFKNYKISYSLFIVFKLFKSVPNPLIMIPLPKGTYGMDVKVLLSYNFLTKASLRNGIKRF